MPPAISGRSRPLYMQHNVGQFCKIIKKIDFFDFPNIVRKWPEMSYMDGNWSFGPGKVSGNNKGPQYCNQIIFLENRKKSSFLTQKITQKIFKVDFSRPIYPGQQINMARRYIPSGPPNPYKTGFPTGLLPHFPTPQISLSDL